MRGFTAAHRGRTILPNRRLSSKKLARRDPVPTAPWAAKLRVPLLHIAAENDPALPSDEARSALTSFPVADKKLIIVPESGAHGDVLLAGQEDGAGVRRTLLEFIDRVIR